MSWQAKRKGQVLIAAGCLTQRYGSGGAAGAEIDGILGTRRWMDIVDVVQRLREGCTPNRSITCLKRPPLGQTSMALRVAVQGASAYIKIADGCRCPCAFCAIPLIKGTAAVSRPVDAILDEARLLQEAGVREIILIAQDTTDYGHDLGMKDGLARLLEGLVAAAPRVDWFRLVCLPGYVTDRLIGS